MSGTIPTSHIEAPIVGSRELSRLQFAVLAVALAIAGTSAIWPTVTNFWVMWTTDALKSIGMLIPPVSLILILRVWQKLDWKSEGTWWGLVPLLLAVVASLIQERAIILLVISPHWATWLLPPSLILLAYGSGAILLLAGTRLYRAALFPIILLWFANPIPRTFGFWVDLPLQRVSAEIARGFAMHLGQRLTPDNLRLMFTPEFGMFIAPGCNGIRGAVTMGFIALIAGYLYRFRWYINALVVAGAILLGYVFNLLRLCMLVLYYLVALHFHSLQDKAENADYVIGATLFLVATVLLFTAIHRFRGAAILDIPEPAASPKIAEWRSSASRLGYAPLAVMTLLSLFGCAQVIRSRMASHSIVASPDSAALRFPERLGNYTLVRTWNETLVAGPVVYVWAQYAPPGGGSPVAIGVSPYLGWHDPLVCHTIRGEHPLWLGQLTVTTAEVVPIDFSASFYNDGVTQYLEAATECSGTRCGESATQRTHFGLIYSHLDPSSLLSEDGKRAVPVLIRIETLEPILPADIARQRLTESLRTFLASTKLSDLTKPYN